LDITFKSIRIKKVFNDEVQLKRKHGQKRAKKIRVRMKEFRAAKNLKDFWPPKSGPSRCHELTGNRSGQLSVDLDHPYRLIFIPDHDPTPAHEDGGLDWAQVTAIKIMGVEDTHE
jgi:proteic killer suppression protein